MVELLDAAVGSATGTLPGASVELPLTEVEYEDRRFVFSNVLMVRVLKEEGGWAFEADNPERVGFGHTREEAELAFCQDFAACWDRIAQGDESKMTQGAIKLKLALLALAKEV